MCSPEKFEELKDKLWTFMKEDIYPNEQLFYAQSTTFHAHNEWTHPPILIELIQKAKKVCRASAKAVQPANFSCSSPA